jgi:hypothetical protein
MNRQGSMFFVLIVLLTLLIPAGLVIAQGAGVDVVAGADMSEEVGCYVWRAWLAEKARIAAIDMDAEVGSYAWRNWLREQARIVAVDLDEEVGGFIWRNWLEGRAVR